MCNEKTEVTSTTRTFSSPCNRSYIGENRKQKKKLKTVKTKVSRSGAKSGKQALKIPLQVGGTTSGSGANVYKPTP